MLDKNYIQFVVISLSLPPHQKHEDQKTRCYLLRHPPTKIHPNDLDPLLRLIFPISQFSNIQSPIPPTTIFYPKKCLSSRTATQSPKCPQQSTAKPKQRKNVQPKSLNQKEKARERRKREKEIQTDPKKPSHLSWCIP